jgi:hypothetical protein
MPSLEKWDGTWPRARLVVRLGDALFVLDAAADRDSLAGAAS